jgi:magnesium chelatase subunit D
MNPEEGDLRPQLLDRFGLAAEVAGPRDPIERAEIIRRRLAFEADPAGFRSRFADAEAETHTQIVVARARLPQVQVEDTMLERITRICLAFDVDGMRADLVIYKTARTLAAWYGRAIAGAADPSRSLASTKLSLTTR